MVPFIIGRSARPKYFCGYTGAEMCFDYAAHSRAWMNCEKFYEWLQRFDETIGQTEDRKVCLLFDNASCDTQSENFPTLANVTIRYLPKNTTSILQPLDAGIISSVKKAYTPQLIVR